MSTIHLSKDGIRYTNDYNPDCDEYVSKLVDSLIPHLRCSVVVHDGFTLEDLFKILEKEVKKYDIIFGSDLGHYPLSLYIDDIKKDAGDVVKDGMEYLEVYWTCNCEAYEQRGYKEWKNSIEISADFHGWGTWTDDPNTPWPDGQRGGFAIEFTPLAELKHYPLKVRTQTKIYLDDGTYDNDEDGNMVSKVLFEGEKYFSVFDFISAILYEISWGGSPEQRDGKMEEIEASAADVKEKIDAGDIESFKSFDELRDSLSDEAKVAELLEVEEFFEKLEELEND